MRQVGPEHRNQESGGERWQVAALALSLVVVYGAVWLPRARGGTFAACYTAGFVDVLLEGVEPLRHIWLGGEPIEREHLSLWYYPLSWLARVIGAPTLMAWKAKPLTSTCRGRARGDTASPPARMTGNRLQSPGGGSRSQTTLHPTYAHGSKHMGRVVSDVVRAVFVEDEDVHHSN